MTLRAGIYARVSTEEQAEEGHSIDAQIRVCRELCARKGWRVVAEYVDAGISGTTLDRPRFQDLLRDLREGKLDIIVVHKLDRFSRSLVDTLTTLSQLSRRGVSFCSATEDFDFTTPIGKVLLALLAAFAQYFIDNLREETKKGLRQRALKGLYNGIVPFGYVRTPREQGGVPAFHPKNIEGYRTAVQWASQGKSMREIADWLNTNGYRTSGNFGPHLFTTDAVRDILRSRFYLGEVSYKSVWRAGLHPAAIDRETWTMCQEQLRRRSFRREGTKMSDRIYPLRKLLYCAVCGHSLRGQPLRGARLYKDMEAASRRCTEPQTVKAEEIERQVGDFLLKAQLPDDWRDQILQQLGVRSNVEQIEAQRRALVNKLTRARKLYIEGDLDDAQYQRDKKAIERELGKLQPVTLPDLERAAQLLQSVGMLWEHATDAERLELARALFEKIWMREGKVVACEPRTALYPLFALIEKKIRPLRANRRTQVRERRASIPNLPSPIIVILPPGVHFTDAADDGGSS